MGNVPLFRIRKKWRVEINYIMKAHLLYTVNSLLKQSAFHQLLPGFFDTHDARKICASLFIKFNN
jgi:hypothetical protein